MPTYSGSADASTGILAASSDMVSRYSVQLLGDLCADDGTRVTEVNLASNAKMTAALRTATGRVVATCLRAERYTRADLASGLTTESEEYLKDIVCRIAFWILIGRKPSHDRRYTQQRKEAAEEYQFHMEELRSGREIFELAEKAEAGKPQVETLTVAAISNQNLIADKARGRYYPQRRTYKDR